MDKVNILGVKVDQLRLDDVLALIGEVVAGGQRAIITHAHIMALNIAYQTPWFRQFLNDASLVYCDGMGVKFGARLLGHHIPQRFTLAGWVWQLAELAERESISIYLLGNPTGVPERAAARLKGKYPGLRIAGTHHGFFNKSKGHPENQAVLAQINSARPNILLVGFGMPAQERWIKENWYDLDVNITITVGALFEYISGDLDRGPDWMVNNYLEWMYRLASRPGRYAQRYLRDNPLFFYRILRQRFFGLTSINENSFT